MIYWVLNFYLLVGNGHYETRPVFYFHSQAQCEKIRLQMEIRDDRRLKGIMTCDKQFGGHLSPHRAGR